MSRKQKLQLHQFEINQDNILEKDIFVYSWPEKLMGLILCQNDDKKLNYAVKNLSGIVTLAIDDIVYTRNNIRKEQKCEADKFWIFSLVEINLDVVKSLIQEWLIISNIKRLTIDDLHIEKPTKISTTQLFEESYKYDLYGLIPQLYNFEFCKHKIEMTSLNNRYLNFFPVIDTKREAVAISNTFDYPVKRTDVERFSYAITFRLVNSREFQDKLFLNVYTGIKIWVCKPLVDISKAKNYISSKHSSSVYVYKENDYLNNKRKKLIGLMYTRDSNEHFKFSGIADSILAKQIKLDLIEALTKPNDYSDFPTLEGEGIVLLTNNKITEKVQYGAGLAERLDIFKAFGSLFPDLYIRELIDVAHIKGNAINKKRKSIQQIEGFNQKFDEYEFIDLKDDKSFYENSPVFISNADKIIIEIYTYNDKLIGAFIEFAVRILSLTISLGEHNFKSCDGYEVEFSPKNAFVARGLSKLEQNNPSLRKSEIKKMLHENKYDSNNVISLIDIEAFHTSSDEEIRSQDPKKYVRSAFKDCGRITQFINGFNPEDKNDRYRLVSSIYDLFSAAGFMDYEYFKHGFNDSILLGLSTCKNSRGKFIVLSKIESGQINFKVCGLSDEKWLTLKELLPKLQLHTLNNIEKLKIDKVFFQQWITKQLNDLGDNSKEHIFYFDASLRSGYWPFAKNKELNVDTLRLITPEKFKFIRVNTTDEVPEYNIFKDEQDTEGLNRNQGLFSNDYRVFYSVGARPDTIQTSLDATKITHSTKMIVKQRIVEFVILNDDLEENMLLATKSHALRKLNLTFDSSTKYPLPMYVNDRFGEYLELF
ncbi:MAG: DUF3962 domain-containing protein [Sedimentibacter saalensis]|uniref:pPIWI_RE module domain-containing protein n=1 Tax=Sedimentibacter saalensis TaxID=130788 RepID=UPI002B21A801|nr:DUF3962 domain-containing protein [Sedimentibacter saalensis]MEA5093377.1 DUF3962 domain-containing protein [Sedimentibacter saalensis]